MPSSKHKINLILYNESNKVFIKTRSKARSLNRQLLIGLFSTVTILSRSASVSSSRTNVERVWISALRRIKRTQCHILQFMSSLQTELNLKVYSNTSEGSCKFVMVARAWFSKIFTHRFWRWSTRHRAKNWPREAPIHTDTARSIKRLACHFWGYRGLWKRLVQNLKKKDRFDVPLTKKSYWAGMFSEFKPFQNYLVTLCFKKIYHAKSFI